MRRPDDSPASPGAGDGHDDVFHGWLPEIHDHLVHRQWDDGKPRKTSTLLVFVENGRWKCSLHDRDGKRGCFASGEGWEGLLEALERSLKDGSVEWRKDTR